MSNRLSVSATRVAFGRTEFRCGFIPSTSTGVNTDANRLKVLSRNLLRNPDLVARFFALPLTIWPNYHGGAAFSYKLAGSILS